MGALDGKRQEDNVLFRYFYLLELEIFEQLLVYLYFERVGIVANRGTE